MCRAAPRGATVSLAGLPNTVFGVALGLAGNSCLVKSLVAPAFWGRKGRGALWGIWSLAVGVWVVLGACFAAKARFHRGLLLREWRSPRRCYYFFAPHLSLVVLCTIFGFARGRRLPRHPASRARLPPQAGDFGCFLGLHLPIGRARDGGDDLRDGRQRARRQSTPDGSRLGPVRRRPRHAPVRGDAHTCASTRARSTGARTPGPTRASSRPPGPLATPSRSESTINKASSFVTRGPP